MDEFIMGVDDRFLVSMADSTIMCILHSAMNKAHAKVQSKHGIIQRLNEQSKFYELAIMQLEACLKFVQDQEESGNYILENTQNKLLFDLFEMKDKLEERLKETEAAIAEKDNELVERTMNENKLQQTLKDKENKLQYCQKSEFREIDGNISELKHTLDEHIWNIKNHIDGEKIALTSRLGHESSPLVSIEDSKFQHESNSKEYDHVKEIDNNVDITHELYMNFGHVELEIDGLKKTLHTLFEMITRCDDHPLEQQWLCMIEKDILNVFLKEVLEYQDKELEDKLNIGINNMVSSKPLCIRIWSNFINDVTLLRDDLERVTFSYEKREKDIKIHGSHKEVIIHDDKSWQQVHEDFEKERNNIEKSKTCFLNEYEALIKYIIKNILRRMDKILTWMISLESGCRKNPVNQEKSKSSIGDKNNSNDSKYKDLIAKHHYQVEQHMKKLNLKFLVASNLKELTNDYQRRLDEYIVQNLISEDIYMNFLNETIQEMNVYEGNFFKELSNHLEECTFVFNIHKTLLCLFLKEVSDEANARPTDVNMLAIDKGRRGISGHVHQMCDFNSQLHILIQDEFKMIYLKEILNLWNLQCVDYTYELLIRECIQQCVVSEVIKHCEQLSKMSSNVTHVKGVESLFTKLDIPLNDFEIEKMKISHSIYLYSSQGKNYILKNENSHLKLTCIEVIGTNSGKNFDGLKVGKDTPSVEFTPALEKCLLQLDEFNATIRELRSDEIIKSEQIDLKKVQEHGKCTLPVYQLHDVESSCNQRYDKRVKKLPYHTFGNENYEDYLYPDVFYDVIDKFRNTLQEKVVRSFSRMEKLNDDVKKLTHEVKHIKKKKIIYKTAFIQRCHNLQKAETEVDILGDTVEALTSLLQRIYSTLNQYSMILQHYPQVLNMRTWIENEIPMKNVYCY